MAEAEDGQIHATNECLSACQAEALPWKGALCL